jgi:pyridoxamine 5'-phosphate oxidase
VVERSLHQEDLDPDPLAQFRRWFVAAQEAGQPEPEAMALATASPSGVPSVRFVLLRGLDERGFVFYTNSRSRKGREMGENPVAALVFRWKLVDRQVRVGGPVAPVDDSESDAYFAGRDRGSQLGAWASEQSAPLGGRVELEDRLNEVSARFAGVAVPRPPWWGGYRVLPAEIEFWQQGPNRLHDRFLYTPAPDGGWAITRLNP